jgi:hypothetical protein
MTLPFRRVTPADWKAGRVRLDGTATAIDDGSHDRKAFLRELAEVMRRHGVLSVAAKFVPKERGA